MGREVAERAAEGWFGVGALMVVALIGLLFLLARLAYIQDLKRRRRMGPSERRAERDSAKIEETEADSVAS